jgi:sigma-B regulation protein RsbU (phosphoserine phosphatase)
MRAQLRASIEAAVAVGASAMNLTVSPARLVSQLNHQLHASTSPEKYSTFFFGLYDDREGSMIYTNAGHLPPVLFRDGSVTDLDINGMVIGAFPFAQYGETRIQLRSRDLLVCYTDGISEPENEFGEMFGTQRLIEVIERNLHRSDEEIVECVTAAVRDWTGSSDLQDDMTILLARRV